MSRYRIGEFAALSGVSVRALHHYDHIGLLQPSERTDTGYRMYADEDLLRLQQILTLRYLGFPLRSIRDLLDGPEFDLMASIGIQRIALRDRMAQLERIDRALQELLDRRRRTGAWDWPLAAGASATVQEGLNAKGERMNDYYSPEEIAEQFKELGKEIEPEERHAIERQWAELLTEVRAARDLEPTDPRAQELASRWDNLAASTFRGNNKLASSVAEGYRQGRYADVEGTPTPEDFAFVQRVREARGA
ncbi:MAG TPA: MerR family transcriptional regulator [Chloroflexota bacterium]